MRFDTAHKWDVIAERDDLDNTISFRLMYLGWTIAFFDTLEEAEKAGGEFKPADGDARFKGVA